MQRSAWVKLLRRLPTEQHSNLVLSTTTGTEVAIQTIIEIADEYLILHGRLTGTTDSGMSLFIPFERINFLAFQKPMKEAELREILGPPPTATPEKEATSPLLARPAALPQSPIHGSTPTAAPGKNAILDRLRARRVTEAAATLPRR